MSCANHLVRLTLFGLVCSVAAVVAAQEEVKDRPAVGIASAEEIANLVRQLDAEQYSQREGATKRLTAIGKTAIPAVSKAAVEGSLEVTGRSIDILKSLYESSDEATKAAAEDALQKLAEGDHGAAARRAKGVLKPKEVPGRTFRRGGMIPGGARKVSVKTINGVKTIEVVAKDRKIEIVEDPKQGIKIAITTKKDGKEETERIEAKNADELQKKNEGAYKLYSAFAQKQNGAAVAKIKLNQGNIRVRALAIPAQARLGRKQVDMAVLMLRNWATQLPRLTGENELKDASKESIAELKKRLDEVKNQIAELEKRIDAQGNAVEEQTQEKKSPVAQPE
ncbi:MAG: hypothetical protein H8E44_35635 [Planctomycetes bacterium]|nr:hypothetical protein [Planctomycetota bacterium]